MTKTRITTATLLLLFGALIASAPLIQAAAKRNDNAAENACRDTYDSCYKGCTGKPDSCYDKCDKNYQQCMAASGVVFAKLKKHPQVAPPNPVLDKGTTTETKPKGKALVSRLPADVAGVELKNGAVQVKSGYKFVKQADGKVVVARKTGGGGADTGLSGTWFCECVEGSGACEIMVLGGAIICLKKTGSACTNCSLTVTVGAARTGIFMY